MENEKSSITLDPEHNKLLIKVYEEICTNIRISDDISFKLLSFVPLISGSGAAILTLGKIWSEISSLAIILISLIAAIITFGLFKWEMRNVQKCDWLIKRAAELEQLHFRPEEPNEEQGNIRQFAGWPNEKKPPLFGKSREGIKKRGINAWHKKEMGKSEAERIIYWASIGAWLVPIIMATIKWKV
jgi:hypothetical protein